MGSTGHVLVVSDHQLDLLEMAAGASRRITELEERWSRFLPASEVSRLNAAGVAHSLSRDTLILVQRAVDGWRRTGGLFDPTILPALIASGYDRTFADIVATPSPVREPSSPAPGCKDIVVDHESATIRLPPQVAFDPGGLGKGLAADLVTSELRNGGATGACVNLGGDLRVVGDAPESRGWVVAVEHPLVPGQELARVRLHGGAVASSSRALRTWGPVEGGRHHLIDPRTGRPSWTGLAGVTVLAGEAWWAEILAKACFVAGPSSGVGLLEAHEVSGLLVEDDGRITLVGDMPMFLL